MAGRRAAVGGARGGTGMKFTVDRDALGEAVTWVARALPTRPVLPVLAGLLLRAEREDPNQTEVNGPGLLTLSCFDYEVSARMRVRAEVAEPGTFLVPGRLLLEIVRSLPAAPVEFGDDPDGISVTCGEASFAVASLPSAEYPELPDLPQLAGTADGGVLATAIGQVTPAARRDDPLPMLTAVNIEFDGETMTLAATDRYRIAVREMAWDPAPGFAAQGRTALLVPARTLSDAAKMMSAGTEVRIMLRPSGDGTGAVASDGGGASGGDVSESDGNVSEGGGGVRTGGGGVSEGRGGVRAGGGGVSEGRGGVRAGGGSVGGGSVGGGGTGAAEAMIGFEAGQRQLTARLLAGEFVRYRSRFPNEFGCTADLPAEAFAEAVRRVALVAERGTPVQLTFAPGRVIVGAATQGQARARESVPADFAGDEPAIAFSPHYLLDGVIAAMAGSPATASGSHVPGGRPGDTDSGSGANHAPAAGVGHGPASGRVRLWFTSASKPAVITSQPDPDSDAKQADADFRYLVVPQRVAQLRVFPRSPPGALSPLARGSAQWPPGNEVPVPSGAEKPCRANSSAVNSQISMARISSESAANFAVRSTGGESGCGSRDWNRPSGPNCAPGEKPAAVGPMAAPCLPSGFQ
jgi:DNA polymerase III subunit beta